MGEHFNSHMVENGWAIDKVVEYLDLTIIGSEEESKKDKMLVCAESDLYLLGYALIIFYPTSPHPPAPSTVGQPHHNPIFFGMRNSS